MVVHLDDLLLRRTHLGLLSHEGARAQLDAVRVPCQRLLGWDDARWRREVERYNEIIERYYSVPGGWA
jgi:glycerol-3-phosphate dehydrogenase